MSPLTTKNTTSTLTGTTTNTTSTTARRHAIKGPADVISVQGRYLVKGNTTERFLMQGMAFPIAPRSNGLDKKNNDNDGYDQEGWIAVLEQLATDTDINTVRLYELNCTVGIPKYDAFFQRAAELGIYVIIPLTSVSGDGVLSRDRVAPICYNETLYEYGQTCMQLMARHDNILAGMIGNEVMNSLATWPAAPCIKAYARDLKTYAAMDLVSTSGRTAFPLVYAAQHDSPTAAVLPDTTMKLTMEYLTCRADGDSDDADDLWVDMFGINVESWCSSLQTFEYEEDGITETAYHALWQTMRNASAVPLVFTEMGCSRALFNRDNGLPRYTRDWHQVPVVLQDMVDVFSGFCAYTYDGNPLFRIMGNSDGSDAQGTDTGKIQAHWNGHDVLEPSQDYYNLAQQLHDYNDKGIVLTTSGTANGTVVIPRRLCSEVRQEILQVWKVPLRPLDKMPMYSSNRFGLQWFWSSRAGSFFAWQAPWTLAVMSAGVVALLFGLARRRHYQYQQEQQQQDTNQKAEPTEADPLLSSKA